MQWSSDKISDCALSPGTITELAKAPWTQLTRQFQFHKRAIRPYRLLTMSMLGNGAFAHTVMSLAWFWVGNVCLEGRKKKGRNKERVEQKQKDFTGKSAAERQPAEVVDTRRLGPFTSEISTFFTLFSSHSFGL